MSPASVAAFPNTLHDIPSAPYYDHEFGGFSTVLTREATVRAPGTYTIKFVVEDVSDRLVDAGLFIEEDSLQMMSLANGDYNTDGVVDGADYSVWSSNFGATPATFDQGDGNGDCVVDIADYTVWRDNLGATGNGDFSADFNRDGVVDAADYTIWRDHLGLSMCASQFEGDADGDGDVDGDDYQVWKSQFGSGGGGSAMAAAGEGAFDDATLSDVMAALAQREAEKMKTAVSAVTGPVLKSMTPENPDFNGDGTVDEEELAKLDAIILGDE